MDEIDRSAKVCKAIYLENQVLSAMEDLELSDSLRSAWVTLSEELRGDGTIETLYETPTGNYLEITKNGRRVSFTIQPWR